MPMQNALAGDDCRTHKSLAAQMETSSATGVARLPARAKAASLPEIGSGDATIRVAAEARAGRLRVLQGARLMPMERISGAFDFRPNDSLLA